MPNAEIANALHIGAAVILLLVFLSSLIGFAWFLTRTKPPRENRRLSRIQHIITWLDRHGKAWRVL